MKKSLIFSLLMISLSGIASDALIIGVSDYKTSPLKNPINDAKLISNKLKSLGWKVTLVTNPNAKELESKLNRFSRSLDKETDVTLVYFSGHGFQYFGENFLVPLNVKDSKIIEDSLSLSEIISSLKNLSNPKIFIVDACRTSILDPDTIPISVGLNSQPAPPNTLISYATAPGKVAYDGEGRYSPFAYSFGNALEDSSDLSEVFLKTRINTMKLTDGEQVPWETSSLSEIIFFESSLNESQNDPLDEYNTSFDDVSLLSQSGKEDQFEDLNNWENVIDYLIDIARKAEQESFLNLYPNYEISPNTEKDRNDVIETFKKYKNQQIDRYAYYSIISSLQEGLTNPDCRENGKLDPNCTNFDKAFIFEPNLESALNIAKLADEENINSSVLARHYRYGWAVNRDLTKAYDLYMKDKNQDSYYFLRDITEMVQEELVNLGYDLKIDGDFGPNSCSAFKSVTGSSTCNNPPRRDEIELFFEKVYKVN